MEAILRHGGCQWRQLPRHFPAFTTVQGYFYRWIREGQWEAMNHILVILSREQDGRNATPSVGIIDSQSVKTAENKSTTDTPSHVVAAVVHPADVQDRDGASLVATKIRSLFPWLRHLIGDGGYAGEKLWGALAELGRWTIEIAGAAIGLKASSSCRNAGSWSAALHGSDAAAALRRMSRQQTRYPARG
ncbi:hypothetical protein GCM10023158_10610 [Gluconacetobacter tumulicola]